MNNKITNREIGICVKNKNVARRSVLPCRVSQNIAELKVLLFEFSFYTLELDLHTLRKHRNVSQFSSWESHVGLVYIFPDALKRLAWKHARQTV
jgi:hypothetical protein